MYVKRSTKAALKVKRHVLSCCVSLFVRFSLCSVRYVNSVLISLSCSPLVRPSGAETHSAVFVMLTCRATQAQKCIHAHLLMNSHTLTQSHTPIHVDDAQQRQRSGLRQIISLVGRLRLIE